MAERGKSRRITYCGIGSEEWTGSGTTLFFRDVCERDRQPDAASSVERIGAAVKRIGIVVVVFLLADVLGAGGDRVSLHLSQARISVGDLLILGIDLRR